MQNPFVISLIAFSSTFALLYLLDDRDSPNASPPSAPSQTQTVTQPTSSGSSSSRITGQFQTSIRPTTTPTEPTRALVDTVDPEDIANGYLHYIARLGVELDQTQQTQIRDMITNYESLTIDRASTLSVIRNNPNFRGYESFLDSKINELMATGAPEKNACIVAIQDLQQHIAEENGHPEGSNLHSTYSWVEGYLRDNLYTARYGGLTSQQQQELLDSGRGGSGQTQLDYFTRIHCAEDGQRYGQEYSIYRDQAIQAAKYISRDHSPSFNSNLRL